MADETNRISSLTAGRRRLRALTRLSPLVRRLVAPNASPFTFNGTCTYIVGEWRGRGRRSWPGATKRISRRSSPRSRARRVETILVTHTHRDHSALANRLRDATGARVVGAEPFASRGDGTGGLDSAHDRDYAPDAVLADGERLQGSGFAIEAIATPGHCANHLCFALLEEGALFSGDHVMAWSTSVVAPPDGSMGAYMASLDKVRARDERIYWPGHGGPVVEPQRYVRGDRSITAGSAKPRSSRRSPTALQTIPELVARVYVGLDPALARAAGLSTLAHLEDLRERGQIVAEAPVAGQARFRRA